MRHFPKTRVVFTIILLITLFACTPAFDSTSSKNSPIQKTNFVLKDTPPTSEQATDYTALSEIDLAYEISASIDEMLNAIQTVIETQDSNNEIQLLVETSQDSIARTDEMIQVYVTLYVEISPECVESLLGIKVGLGHIASILDEIGAIINQEDSSRIVELQGQLKQILMNSDLKEKTQNWPTQVQSKIDERVKTYAQIQPQVSQIAHHRVGAFTQAYEFMDVYQEALEDGKFTPVELSEISQMGANAQASLYSTGDPQLFDISVMIKALVNLAISGQWPQAQESISELQRSLPARPQP